jgi:hypothetical protein
MTTLAPQKPKSKHSGTQSKLQVVDGGNQDKKPVRHHCKVSIEDVDWVLQQPPSVQQLYLECIRAEQFGGSAHTLDTLMDIKGKTFKKAREALSSQGLFVFEPVHELMASGQSKVVAWKVINCHGYFNRHYWEIDPQTEVKSLEALARQGDGFGKSSPVLQETAPRASVNRQGDFGKQTPPLPPEMIAAQEFEKTQLPSNYSSTTNQQPTKVVELVVGSSSQVEVNEAEETAIEPLGGSLPSPTECDEEEEEEGVTDCSQAPETVNPLTRAEPLNYLEAESSAPPPAFFETRQSISDRIAAKQRLISDLKMFCDLEKYPGFDFLLKCWNEGSPELKQRIRKALIRFPGWEIEITDDGELVEVSAVPWEKIAQEMEKLEQESWGVS